jgi:drug/metabolite transporter (DMT)-like permease
MRPYCLGVNEQFGQTGMSFDIRTATLVFLALVAFAANSVLTRMALGSHEIDAATFTCIRLGSGALVLALVVRFQAGTWKGLRGGDAWGPIALFMYALPFSFAYLRIGAATGALVLFGTVQLTMIGYGLLRGERPTLGAWVGLVLATGGLVALILPSATSPDAPGFGLMLIAGIAWAAYSLAGRGVTDPTASVARSFLWSALPAFATAMVLGASGASARGIILALISGAVTSGLGYAIWYRVLPRLSVMKAAVAQLSVPVIAAVAAVALLGERVTPRLFMSGAAVLSGVGLVLMARARRKL